MKLLLIFAALLAQAQENLPTFGLPFPPVGRPVGGTDGVNFQPLNLDGSGFLKVNIAGGVGTVNQGTNPWIVAGTVTANQGGAPWSFAQSGLPFVINQTQQAGVTLGPPTTYGTAPLLEKVIGVNAFVTNPISAVQSGPWNVGVTPTMNFGSSFSATGTPIGFKDSGGLAMAAGNLDSLGNLRVLASILNQITLPSLTAALPKPPNPIPVITNNNPCINNVPGDQAISQAGTALLLTGQPGLRILICYDRVIAGAAEQVSEVEGTGATCSGGTVKFHSGSSTAANGEPLAANGGYINPVPFYLLPGNNFCIQQAGTARIAGKVSYLYVP